MFIAFIAQRIRHSHTTKSSLTFIEFVLTHALAISATEDDSEKWYYPGFEPPTFRQEEAIRPRATLIINPLNTVTLLDQ